VAKNEQFQELAARSRSLWRTRSPDRLALLTTEATDGKSVELLIEEASSFDQGEIELGGTPRSTAAT